MYFIVFTTMLLVSYFYLLFNMVKYKRTPPTILRIGLINIIICLLKLCKLTARSEVLKLDFYVLIQDITRLKGL